MTEPVPPAPVLTEDQTSGRLFVRWNLAALVVGLVALVIGGALVRAERAQRSSPAAPPPIAPGPGDR